MNDSNCINVVLVEYINRNLGDPAIAECAYYLVDEALKNLKINNYFIHEYNMYNRDMLFISKADVIIFAGGGLIKYKREKFFEFIPEILDTAEKNNIPVYFNCVGVEGYDENDDRCMALKKVLNYDCVKGITIRDDYETYIENYREKDLIVGNPLDSVSLACEVYKQSISTKTNTIGLQLARPELYEDYGVYGFSKDEQIVFWKKIIEKIELETEYDWKLFTNGLHSDYIFCKELLYSLNKNIDKYLVKRPTEVRELVSTISSFKAIIATRLHSNIIAYSVDTPSIGLVWNAKMIQWGKAIEYEIGRAHV